MPPIQLKSGKNELYERKCKMTRRTHSTSTCVLVRRCLSSSFFLIFLIKFPTTVGVRWLANSHLFIVTQFSSCSSCFGSPLLAHSQFVMAAAPNRSLVLMMDNTTIKRRWKIANLKVNSQIDIWVFKLAILQGTFQFGIGSQKYWRWAYRKVNQIEKLELPRTSVQGI